MNRLITWIMLVALAALPGVVLSAEGGGGVGIVKGTITIGGKPAPDAVVSIEGVPAEHVKAQIAITKAQKKIMDQRNTKFIPTVLAMMVGGTVDFPNNDSTWHNVYSKGGANNFDIGLYPPGETRSAKFEKPGVSRILCNAHPNMEAFIVVKEHPYFSAADKRGDFRVDGVPLGNYRVQVWHPQLGTRESTVEIVREGQVLNINFDLKKQ
jgi:plastocyanin